MQMLLPVRSLLLDMADNTRHNTYSSLSAIDVPLFVEFIRNSFNHHAQHIGEVFDSTATPTRLID
jgi:hypothetical protein